MLLEPIDFLPNCKDPSRWWVPMVFMELILSVETRLGLLVPSSHLQIEVLELSW